MMYHHIIFLLLFLLCFHFYVLFFVLSYLGRTFHCDAVACHLPPPPPPGPTPWVCHGGSGPPGGGVSQAQSCCLIFDMGSCASTTSAQGSKIKYFTLPKSFPRLNSSPQALRSRQHPASSAVIAASHSASSIQCGTRRVQHRETDGWSCSVARWHAFRFGFGQRAGSCKGPCCRGCLVPGCSSSTGCSSSICWPDSARAKQEPSTGASAKAKSPHGHCTSSNSHLGCCRRSSSHSSRDDSSSCGGRMQT